MTEGPYKLPEGWRWVRLGEVAWREANLLKPSEEPSKRFRYIGMEQVKSGQWEEPQPIEVEGHEIKSQVVKFRPGIVLYGRLRPYLNKVAVPLFEGVASTEFVPIATRQDVLISHYLGAFLRSPAFVTYASHNTTGSRQPRVRYEALWEALIPLPPLNEQQRIVTKVEALLEQVCEARVLRQKACEDIDRLWQAVLADTFPRPGADLPPTWRWVRLGEVCEHKTGIWGPEALNPTMGFPIVRSTEIEGMFMRPEIASIREVPKNRLDVYALKSGDILVNKSSGSPQLVGWPALFEDPKDGKTYLFSNFMLRLRVEESILMPRFLLYYLHSPIARLMYLDAQDTTSGLRNLRVRDFVNQPISLPPLNEQQRIVAHLEAVQKEIESLKESQAKFEIELQCLEQSILDSAFRGEL